MILKELHRLFNIKIIYYTENRQNVFRKCIQTEKKVCLVQKLHHLEKKAQQYTLHPFIKHDLYKYIIYITIT